MLNVVMLSVVMLIVVMLSVVMLNVVMLSVVGPVKKTRYPNSKSFTQTALIKFSREVLPNGQAQYS
jgi:hypothetical protein